MFRYLESTTTNTAPPTKFIFPWESTVHFKSKLQVKKCQNTILKTLEPIFLFFADVDLKQKSEITLLNCKTECINFWNSQEH